jgi:hypothetical protein
MAIDRASPIGKPLWNGRMVEWGMLLVLVLVVIGVFGRQARVVQGQAERATVISTLGALRTALVIAHLQKTLDANKPIAAPVQRNPFMLLASVPPNYAGEFGALQMEHVAPGSWVFDPDCNCIGYLPLYAEWLESPPNTQAAWFTLHGAPGPMQISARENYVWQGQVVN